jgi:hypothetical protein
VTFEIDHENPGHGDHTPDPAFNALTGAPEAMFIASCETPLQHAHKIGAADAPALMHGSDA